MVFRASLITSYLEGKLMFVAIVFNVWLALGDNIEFFFKCNTGLEPDTWPYKEPSLQKKIFDSSQNTPYICQITFRTRTSKIQKKIFPIMIFLTFSFRILLHLVRRFQKGITLGVMESFYIFWVGGAWRGSGWVWPGVGSWPDDPKCYTFLESSHQM